MTLGRSQMGATVCIELISELQGDAVGRRFRPITQGRFSRRAFSRQVFYTVRVTLDGFIPLSEQHVSIIPVTQVVAAYSSIHVSPSLGINCGAPLMR